MFFRFSSNRAQYIVPISDPKSQMGRGTVNWTIAKFNLYGSILEYFQASIFRLKETETKS
mgnify:CR=1 FL=1